VDRLKKGKRLGGKYQEKKRSRWKVSGKEEGEVERMKKGLGLSGKDEERKRTR